MFRDSGYQLQRIQEGKDASNWKPFLAIGPGTIEIRIQDKMAYRVIVVATFPEAVLHVFVKRTAKTAQRDVDLARRRYRNLLIERRSQ